MKNKLSVVMITKNEEKNIERCLQSVLWADEIVLLDSGSSDKTLELAGKYPVKIHHSAQWEGFGKAKQQVVNLAENDWVFLIDADEVIREDLKEKVKSLLENPEPSVSGYRIKRISYYCGQPILHSGWDKDYTLRFFNRQFGNYNDKIVHEHVVIKGQIGKIQEVLLHFTYPEIENHILKMITYAKMGAIQDYNKGKRRSLASAVFVGFHKFVHMYLIKAGFLDGKIGFILAWTSAFGSYLKYLYIWELKRKSISGQNSRSD